MSIDEFEKAGIDLPPELKAKLAVLVEVMGLDLDALVSVLRPPPEPVSLATLGLTLHDFETVQQALLPKTGSKGHWRDILPPRHR